MAVEAARGCEWDAKSNANWITVGSGSHGTGNGSVRLVIAANTGSARTGTATIAGKTVTVEQAALSCTYEIKPTSYNAGHGHDDVRVNVTTPSGCTWTATSPADWVTVAEGRTGSGPGSVRLLVDENNGPERTADLTLAGQNFHLVQNGCTTKIKPSYYDAGRGPDEIRIEVSAARGCTWTASSPVSWVTVADGRTGSGDGTVRLVVEANSGAERSATLTIASQSFELHQNGSR